MREWHPLRPDQPVELHPGVGVVALDGERQHELGPDARVTVQVAGAPDLLADAAGERWSVTVPLSRGRNVLHVVAAAPARSTTTAKLLVLRVEFLIAGHR